MREGVRTGGRSSRKLSTKFNRCVKSVGKTVKARPKSTKESAAIAICTKSVLQTRGLTMKRYRKGRLVTQRKRLQSRRGGNDAFAGTNPMLQARMGPAAAKDAEKAARELYQTMLGVRDKKNTEYANKKYGSEDALRHPDEIELKLTFDKNRAGAAVEYLTEMLATFKKENPGLKAEAAAVAKEGLAALSRGATSVARSFFSKKTGSGKTEDTIYLLKELAKYGQANTTLEELNTALEYIERAAPASWLEASP